VGLSHYFGYGIEIRKRHSDLGLLNACVYREAIVAFARILTSRKLNNSLCEVAERPPSEIYV
jgi:hypothetical protein